MLIELNVENFALIDRLALRFGPGLTVLTGETGAGKSIIVDALNAVLGERVGADMVRQGCEKAIVQAAFDISESPEVVSALQRQGIEPEETLVLSREISSQGKSQCRVNGRLASVSALREITTLLADVHGQHEHQLLLSPRWQIQSLDDYAGADVGSWKRELAETFRSLQAAVSEIEKLTTDDRERARLVDLYKFQIQEIDRAGLMPGEEEELKAKAVKLANAEKLFLAIQGAHASLSGSDDDKGAFELIGRASMILEPVAAYDRKVAEIVQALNEALISIDESAQALAAWGESFDVSLERIDEVQSRLEMIASLKRKYGESIEDILAYKDKAAQELAGIEFADRRRAELMAERDRLREKAGALAGLVSKARKSIAPSLSKLIESEMADLGMPGGRFLVSIEPCELGPGGSDRVEFLISANAGEEPRPLSRVASGGEASRIMLALKTVLAASDPVVTLVFDEIDSGIGGRTANVVGEKLKALADSRQALCVTHLAQIARFADFHYLISKIESQGRVTVRVSQLDDERRVEELARMLGGDEESEVAYKHARELLGAGAKQDN